MKTRSCVIWTVFIWRISKWQDGSPLLSNSARTDCSWHNKQTEVLSPSSSQIPHKYSVITSTHQIQGGGWWRSRMEAQGEVDQRQCRNLGQMSHLLLLQGKYSSLSEIDRWMDEDLRNEKAWYPDRIIVEGIFILLLDLWNTLWTVTWDVLRFSGAAIEDCGQNLTCLSKML